MEFTHLDIRTPHSRVGDYYAMTYKDFNKDMGDYISKVVMNARFKNTQVNSNDIAFFAPDLSDWNQEALLTGKFFMAR